MNPTGGGALGGAIAGMALTSGAGPEWMPTGLFFGAFVGHLFEKWTLRDGGAV